MSGTGMVMNSELCSEPSIHIIYASCDSHTVSCMCSGPGVLKNQLSLRYGCGDVCWSIGRFRMILLGCLHLLAWEYVLLESPLVSPEWRLSSILVNAINWAEYCGFLSYSTKLYSTLNKGNNAGWQKRDHEFKKLLKRMELPTLPILQRIALIWLLSYPLPCLTMSWSYIVVCALVKDTLKLSSWSLRISSKLLELCNMHTVLNPHKILDFRTAKFMRQNIRPWLPTLARGEEIHCSCGLEIKACISNVVLGVHQRERWVL